METLMEQIRLFQFKRLRNGDKIHLKSRNGIYTFLKRDKWTGEIFITCNRWRYEDNPIRVTTYNDFKCLAGGVWNLKKAGIA